MGLPGQLRKKANTVGPAITSSPCGSAYCGSSTTTRSVCRFDRFSLSESPPDSCSYWSVVAAQLASGFKASCEEEPASAV